jgi:ElaB/YqjD/DUF883 family membrane-anchored ribosome-binding protein
MARVTGTACTTEAIAERFAPARETIDDAIREGRRAIVRAQHAAEDAAAAATLIIRRRPLAAVAMAGATGLVVGGLIAMTIGSLTRCANEE